MCDCWMCNQTEEDMDGYIEWEYEQYCKTTDQPLSLDNWLKSLPGPRSKK